jgi:hypothetical protein
MLPILHDVNCHRYVPVPRRRDVNDFEIELGQLLEIPIALTEALRLRLARIGDSLLGMRYFFRYQVANCFDLDIFYREQVTQQAAASTTDTDDSQAHPLSRFEGHVDHGRSRIFAGLPLLCIVWCLCARKLARNYRARANGHALLQKASSRDIDWFLLNRHPLISAEFTPNDSMHSGSSPQPSSQRTFCLMDERASSLHVNAIH